jgi:hypothetical protein
VCAELYVSYMYAHAAKLCAVLNLLNWIYQSHITITHHHHTALRTLHTAGGISGYSDTNVACAVCAALLCFNMCISAAASCAVMSCCVCLCQCVCVLLSVYFVYACCFCVVYVIQMLCATLCVHLYCCVYVRASACAALKAGYSVSCAAKCTSVLLIMSYKAQAHTQHTKHVQQTQDTEQTYQTEHTDHTTVQQIAHNEHNNRTQ